MQRFRVLAGVCLLLVGVPFLHGQDAKRPDKRLININTASAAELVRLPQIGPARAQAIITERQTRPFRSVDDLIRVPGIGPGILQQLRPLVSLGSEPGATAQPAPATRRLTPAEVLESFKRLKYPDQQRLILRLIGEGMSPAGRHWLRRKLCGQTGPDAGPINVNTACVKALSGIAEISQELAEAIVKSRPSDGYRSVGDLIFVDGMTKDVLLKIRHLITVEENRSDHDGPHDGTEP